MQQKNSLLKLHNIKRERALGALNGTLLRVSLSASHKILFWKKGPLKNVIVIFQNIKKTLKDGSLFTKCKKKTPTHTLEVHAFTKCRRLRTDYLERYEYESLPRITVSKKKWYPIGFVILRCIEG